MRGVDQGLVVRLILVLRHRQTLQGRPRRFWRQGIHLLGDIALVAATCWAQLTDGFAIPAAEPR